MSGPFPLIGKRGHVELANIPLVLHVPDFHDTEAKRFGDKMSVGDLRYSDFNPYETAEAASRFNAGYGLARYSDIDDIDLAHKYVLEAEDVDCADGYMIMSGKRATETLPGADGPTVWIGTYVTAGGTTMFLAVAGTRVYRRAITGVWSLVLTLSAPAIKGAVGTFGTTLVFGYGAAAEAEYTTDGATLNNITNDAGAPANLYVFAFAADASNAFIAGGTSPTADVNQVMSSLNGQVYQVGSIVDAAPPGEQIVGLAPGGGVANLFFTTKRSLGMIDTNNDPRELVPFDWYRSHNGTCLGWWLGRSDDQQRGPLVLHFVRDGEPFLYQPGGSDSAGQAVNIAQWVDPATQPPNQIGTPTAFWGTARYLYYAIKNMVSGESFILRRNFLTGATTHYWDLSTNDCDAIAMVDGSVFSDTQPYLVIAYGTGGIRTTPLPRTGSNPLADDACRYAGTGLVRLPGFDMGFRDEQKIEFAVRVDAENLVPSVRFVQIEYAVDNEVFTPLGTADQNPITEILFTPPPASYVLNLRARFTNTDETATPKVHGIVLRRSINPTLYRWWEFKFWVPPGQGQYSDDIQNGYAVKQALWAARRAGVPVTFIDEYGDAFNVRIMSLDFQLVQPRQDAPPSELGAVSLLQTYGSAAVGTDFVFDGLTAANPWPIPETIGDPALYFATIDASQVITSSLTDVSYGTWTITGPATYIKLRNATDGSDWVWQDILGPGDTLEINFSPTKKTIVDSEGNDRTDGTTTMEFAWPGLVTGSIWWGIEPGNSTVEVLMGGCTADTSATYNVSVA